MGGGGVNVNVRVCVREGARLSPGSGICSTSSTSFSLPGTPRGTPRGTPGTPSGYAGTPRGTPGTLQPRMSTTTTLQRMLTLAHSSACPPNPLP
eukprot:180514-Chlamydomonas_euryale.AAC.2